MKLVLDKTKQNTVMPKVMKAAVKLFVEKGIDGTTTKDIAEKSGVSEGALYRHFKSKDELAWYIFSKNLNEFSLDLMARVSAEKKTYDKIRVYISICFKAFEEDRDLFTYLILSENRELRKFPVTHTHPGHVAMALIKEGIEAGELRQMAAYVATSLLLGSLIRLCLVRIYGRLTDPLKKHENDIVECLWNALKK